MICLPWPITNLKWDTLMWMLINRLHLLFVNVCKLHIQRVFRQKSIYPQGNLNIRWMRNGTADYDQLAFIIFNSCMSSQLYNLKHKIDRNELILSNRNVWMNSKFITLYEALLMLTLLPRLVNVHFNLKNIVWCELRTPSFSFVQSRRPFKISRSSSWSHWWL